MTGITLRDAPGNHRAQYSSGGAVYVEEFRDGRLLGRFWSSDGVVDESRFWESPAFELAVKDKPTSSDVPGALLSDGWRWEGFRELPAQDGDTRHVVVDLSHYQYRLKLGIHTMLDGTPILERWLEITNQSDKPIAITEVSPWCGRLWSGDGPVTLGHALRRDVWYEAWFGWTPLQEGANQFRNTEGLVWDSPYFVLRNESTGAHFFGHLAWPVNYSMEFDKADGLSFKVGPIATNTLRVLEPEETADTPAVHLGCVPDGFHAAVQAMHDHIRRSVRPPIKPENAYLSQIIAVEDQLPAAYRGKEYNEATAKKSIDVAAAAGIDIFILDGPYWVETLGDWMVSNQQRFPSGIAALSEYAHSKGLRFGLYAESEGARQPFSDIDGTTLGPITGCQTYKEHPEWFLKDHVTSPDIEPRYSYNLAIPEAAEHMESQIAEMIQGYNLDLFRHDSNNFHPDAHDSPRHGFLENQCWRHYDGFFRAFDNLRARFPKVIFQQACGGARRSEPGTVARFHENFTGDRAGMPYLYRTLSGFGVFLPPEILVTANGMSLPGGLPDVDTVLRGAYALGNTPMIFYNSAILPKTVEEFRAGEIEGFQRYANLYKIYVRPMMPTFKVWHHAPVSATGGVETGDWFAMEFTSPDRCKGWAVVIRLDKDGDGAYLLKPKGLDQARDYRVTFDNTGETRAINGASFNENGIAIKPEPGWRSEMVFFESCQ